MDTLSLGANTRRPSGLRTSPSSGRKTYATVSWPGERRIPSELLRLAADENFNNAIVRGVIRRNPEVDIVTIQESGLSGASDESVLEWAADNGRILLTHDVSTMTKFAYERIERGLPMPGVLEVNQTLAVGAAIEDILLLAECSLVLSN